MKPLIESVLGTAGEALENNAYNKSVKKYGEDTARTIISVELQKAGESLETFDTYVRVKKKIQTGQISPKKAIKDAENLAKATIAEAF